MKAGAASTSVQEERERPRRRYRRRRGRRRHSLCVDAGKEQRGCNLRPAKEKRAGGASIVHLSNSMTATHGSRRAGGRSQLKLELSHDPLHTPPPEIHRLCRAPPPARLEDASPRGLDLEGDGSRLGGWGNGGGARRQPRPMERW